MFVDVFESYDIDDVIGVVFIVNMYEEIFYVLFFVVEIILIYYCKDLLLNVGFNI